MQDVVEHFSARTLFSSSPPTLFAPLAAPSCQSLSGQLTGSCRAFPATRAAGKRPSAALFDVPSPLILFTWSALCTFSSQQKLHLLSSSLLSLQQSSFQPLYEYIRLFFLFSFFSLHIKHTPCLQLFVCQHGGQKFWHCVAQMPYFPGVACLELWFIRSLACRGHFLRFSGKLQPKTLVERIHTKKMLQEEVGNDCEALCFHPKHKRVSMIHLILGFE